MTEVTTLRSYLLRATYLLIFVGLGLIVWPGLIHHAMARDPMHGAAGSLLAAVTIMAATPPALPPCEQRRPRRP